MASSYTAFVSFEAQPTPLPPTIALREADSVPTPRLNTVLGGPRLRARLGHSADTRGYEDCSGERSGHVP